VVAAAAAGVATAHRAGGGSQGWSFRQFAGISRYFVRLLDSLGCHARLRTVGNSSQVGFDKFYRYLNDSRNKAQMGAYWTKGVPVARRDHVLPAVRLIQARTGDNVNTPEFCNPELDRRIDHALGLQATDPAKAGAAWAAADRQIVDQAPAIGLLVPQGIDLVSKRVGNYQRNPGGKSS
jgi:ABC-type transport system substrate-binding protein